MSCESDNIWASLDNGVEDFVLVWLDTRTSKTLAAEETHADVMKRQSQLETIISFTRTFNDPEECRLFIESSKTEKVFLITCGYLGELLIPKVHELSHLEVIYIFCIHQQQHSTWAKSYNKIRAVCGTTNELLAAFTRDVSMYTKNLTPLSIFSADLSKEVSLRSLNVEEKRFMWFQLLLQVLLRMPPNENARSDMRDECERAYRGNVVELAKIDEFFRTYSPEDCIRWYTKDSFIYRLLNKAFRTENIDIIFKFRFFIVDLHDALKKLHQPFTGILWRGQTMSVAQLQILKDSKNKFVSVNTFFSTTKSSNDALSFSGQVTDIPRLISVVFEIDVNEHLHDTEPFADISHLSTMPKEGEVLFAMNTIFRLTDVEQCGSIWTVYLTLSNDSEQSLKSLMDYLKKEIIQEQMPPLLILGEFLWKMGDYSRAERYYRMLLREISPSHEMVGKIYNNIGLLTMESGKSRQAMHYFNEALRLQESTETLDLAETYSNIALLYDMKEETKQAMSYNEKSLKIRLRLLPHDHVLVGLTYNNIGMVHFHQHDYEKALTYLEKNRSINCIALGSSNHFDHATTLSNIGLVHLEQGHYELALQFFKEALVIREHSLPARHPQFAETYNNIGSTQEQLGELNEALTMLERALEVRLATLQPEHPEIAESYNNLANVLETLGRPDEALANYFKALKNTHGTSPKAMRSRALYFNNIGEHFSDEENFVEALKYHQKSLRIRLRLFSRKRDPDLAMSYNNIGLLFYYQYEFKKALRYHFRALTIRREVHQPEHPRVALSLFNIGLVYFETNEYEASLDYLRQALDIETRTLPVGHERIKNTTELITLITQKIAKKIKPPTKKH
ncbi:unnamed protein product [Rotaria magnacalcarata]|uniref:NAD(P)(+)--arginine ADP-ribosyltransferase n=2 Tax=Rotaria magnacalcarata TaxID=392030 RepID=A0A815HZG8_9BILA|nr:unnamed protein product [Rotaria magnacalcarata]CAF3961617.1 unnamed protein product [Rotaria magnacalcarata]